LDNGVSASMRFMAALAILGISFHDAGITQSELRFGGYDIPWVEEMLNATYDEQSTAKIISRGLNDILF